MWAAALTDHSVTGCPLGEPVSFSVRLILVSIRLALGGSLGATCEEWSSLDGGSWATASPSFISFSSTRDFKALDLEMVVSRCLLGLEPFLLGSLPQRLT